MCLQLLLCGIARDGLGGGGGLVIRGDPARNPPCLREVALSVGEYGQYQLVVEMLLLGVTAEKWAYYPSKLCLVSLSCLELATEFPSR